jgi:hypothetical protein
MSSSLREGVILMNAECLKHIYCTHKENEIKILKIFNFLSYLPRVIRPIFVKRKYIILGNGCEIARVCCHRHPADFGGVDVTCLWGGGGREAY